MALLAALPRTRSGGGERDRLRSCQARSCMNAAIPVRDLGQHAAGESVSTQRIQPVCYRTFTRCMEQLQEGYVLSVAATAGCTVEPVQRDINGVDLMIIRQRPQLEEISLYAQLKNTTTKTPDPDKPSFGFQFRHRAHFDRLAIERSTIKAVLLVMVTDPDQSKWTAAHHESLSVRKCCYWVNLEGQQSTAEQPTVRVPTDQVFSALALSALLERIERGEPL